MRALQVGDFVKVSRDGQRMWFEIIVIDGDRITARLDNHPATEIEWGGKVTLPKRPTMAFGDVTQFNFSDVIDLLPKDTAP